MWRITLCGFNDSLHIPRLAQFEISQQRSELGFGKCPEIYI